MVNLNEMIGKRVADANGTVGVVRSTLLGLNMLVRVEIQEVKVVDGVSNLDSKSQYWLIEQVRIVEDQSSPLANCPSGCGSPRTRPPRRIVREDSLDGFGCQSPNCNY